MNDDNNNTNLTSVPNLICLTNNTGNILIAKLHWGVHA